MIWFKICEFDIKRGHESQHLGLYIPLDKQIIVIDGPVFSFFVATFLSVDIDKAVKPDR